MKFTRIALAAAIASISFGASATNGYFSHGYGMKAKGMAGVSTAMTDNAFFGANNPATAAFAGNRLDLGVDLFMPWREAKRSGSTGGLFPADWDGDFDIYDDYGSWPYIPPIDGKSESDSNYFLVPEFGYNYMYSPDLALGITVYGNGGMNTDYSKDFYGKSANILGGDTKLGVDLMQLIIAPTIAYKVAPNHSIGVSPLLGYQRFEANGLQAFGLISQDPSNLTNKGHDDSFGYGVRVGYYGKLTPTFAIGAAYASKMNFEEFDDYKGLFADKGDFDIPENYNIGFAWQATPSLLIGFDYQRINYSGVDSVSNPSNNFYGCVGYFPYYTSDNPYCLGGKNGSGFGWEDMNIYKIGAEYKYNKTWTFRAGYSHTDQPIPKGDVEFNIIAPAVVEDHVTLGFTYTRDNGDELTMAYMHAFENSVKGPSLFFGGQDEIQMSQDSIGVQYSWKM